MSFANFLDSVGTNLNLPEIGLSELFNNGTKTQNTGRVAFNGTASAATGIAVPGLGTALALGGNQAFNAAQQGGNTGSTATGNGGGGVIDSGPLDPNAIRRYTGSDGSTTSYNPAQVALYDQGINQLNSSLGRLPNQLDIALGNIGSQYNQNNNSLDSALNGAKSSYDTSGVQNQQSLRTNRNTITDQSSQGLRGLMRTLGAHNALGSSDMLNASGAVQNVATSQNNGAGQTFAQNQQSLDTNWGNYQNEDKNKRAQLNDWRSSQENSARSQSETTKQDVLNKLADMASKKAAYMGGNSALAAQPYLDQANGLSAEIDNLGRIAPTYSGTTPVYTAPSLSSYDTGRGTGITTGAPDGTNSSALATILGLANKKQSPFNF